MGLDSGLSSIASRDSDDVKPKLFVSLGLDVDLAALQTLYPDVELVSPQSMLKRDVDLIDEAGWYRFSNAFCFTQFKLCILLLLYRSFATTHRLRPNDRPNGLAKL